MEYGEIYQWARRHGVFEGPAQTFAAWVLEKRLPWAQLPEAYDAWRATLGIPSVADVEREIVETEARTAFVKTHSAKEVADWIRAGSPV